MQRGNQNGRHELCQNHPPAQIMFDSMSGLSSGYFTKSGATV
jgi:hypothetical protein